MKIFNLFIILFASAQLSLGQNVWGTQGRYLTQNGKPIYLSGANYTVSDGWMINLPNLPKQSVDADMAALQSIGINHVRVFPFWNLTQPIIDKLDNMVMKQLDMLTESAKGHDISMQIAPITGWMSGAVFLPSWAVGDMFRDPEIIEGQKFLCKSIAERYQNNPAVLGYDFGNELNVLADRLSIGASRDQIFQWMKQIYSAFKDNSQDKLITNGIGTGYDKKFDVRNITQTADYLSPHSYPYFHGTYRLDPWYGQRNTYSPNFIMSWCEMMGKPVVLQEFGCSEGWLPALKIGAYLRLNYMSTWADGAAGFIWWGSHDIDTTFRVKSRDLQLQYSSSTFADGKFDELEYHLGLLSTQNVPKESAESYAHCIKTVNELGFSWIDELPVCYIIVPVDISFNEAMHKFITSYSLAKQAHFDVKLCYEGIPIPPDAKAVFIPGLKLSGKAKDVIQSYLVKGGTVYQSYENDFGSAITTESDTVVANPSLIVTERVGLMEVAQHMSVPAQISFKKVSCNKPAKSLVSFATKSNPLSAEIESGKPVFLTQPIGKGTYYYFAGNMEYDLAKTYNPWPKTNFELFYTALKPQTPIDIDNKFVELYVKRDGDQSILMLLNHSEQYQQVTVQSINPLTFVNFETKEKMGSGKEIAIVLKPAEVVIANIQKIEK